MEERQSILREYLEAILIAAVFLGFSNNFLVKTFYIPSGSMKETLLIGDHLFVNRFIFGQQGGAVDGLLAPVRDIRRGDIVIFRSPEDYRTDLVKRCIGLPGDRIKVVNKRLFVNEVEVEDDSYTMHVEPTIIRNPIDGRRTIPRDNFATLTVPEGEYFFMGDNRDQSNDSRFWGTVPRHLIKGRAQMIYWSYEGETPDGVWRGWGNKLKQLGGTAAGFFTKTRWKRTFHVVR